MYIKEDASLTVTTIISVLWWQSLLLQHATLHYRLQLLQLRL